jgi:hypothetical protein
MNGSSYVAEAVLTPCLAKQLLTADKANEKTRMSFFSSPHLLPWKKEGFIRVSQADLFSTRRDGSISLLDSGVHVNLPSASRASENTNSNWTCGCCVRWAGILAACFLERRWRWLRSVLEEGWRPLLARGTTSLSSLRCPRGGGEAERSHNFWLHPSPFLSLSTFLGAPCLKPFYFTPFGRKRLQTAPEAAGEALPNRA